MAPLLVDVNFILASGRMVTTLINYGGGGGGGGVSGRCESTAYDRSWKGGSLHQNRDRLTGLATEEVLINDI